VSAFAAPWAAQAWLRWRGATYRDPGVWALAAGLTVLALFSLLTLGASGLGAMPWWLRWGLVVLALLAALLMFVVTHGLLGPTRTWPGVGLAVLGWTVLWAGLSLVHGWHAAASDEFWQRDSASRDLRNLEATLTFWGDRLTRGAAQDLPGVLLSPDPRLHWLQASRFPRLAIRPARMPDEQPPVVVAEAGVEPGTGYRGQGYRSQEDLLLPDAAAWLRWFVYRAAETRPHEVVFWVREDVLTAQSPPVP
ncbi:MAG: hypothetical protein GXO37_05205, partial [Chloroflexi bacterium]|nr:hypothetical protein [Chloroflexota bacterium]